MSNSLGDQLKATQLEALATVFEGKIFFGDNNTNPGRKLTALFPEPGSEPKKYVQMDIHYIIREGTYTVFSIAAVGKDAKLLFQSIVEGNYSYYRDAVAGDESYEWLMAMYQHYRAIEDMIGTKWWPTQDEDHHTWAEDKAKKTIRLELSPQSSVWEPKNGQ